MKHAGPVFLGPPCILNSVATRWWKKFEHMFTRFDRICYTNVTDGRSTNGHTPHDSIMPRLCIASRGKNGQKEGIGQAANANVGLGLHYFANRFGALSECAPIGTTADVKFAALSLEMFESLSTLLSTFSRVAFVFIARQHTDARYWYSNSVRLSVRCVPVFYRNDLTYCHSFFNHL